MPFLMYRDNDSGLRPSSYPYILGRALNQYKINTAVIIYILDTSIMWLYSTGHHTLHGIITHPRMSFIARGHRPSAIIASEGE